MSERDGYHHGVPCWIDTWQPDADTALAFYTGLFGWEAEDTMPPGVEGKHYMCRLRDRDVAAVASRPQSAPAAIAWTTYVWVDSVEEAVVRAGDAGGDVAVEPFDSLDGGRIAILADAAGAAIGVWQPGSHKGAQVVNEPGAWSMSQLLTPDTEMAKSFYGSVFGWETEEFGDGLTLWRLPDFVGGEPEQPVPRDVVAVMMAGDDQPGWSVDFWIDDADRAAERAAELGGDVATPPFDSPGFRNAVLVDPQGAGFSVSQPKTGGS